MTPFRCLILAALLAAGSSPARASICDYRLSNLLSGVAPATARAAKSGTSVLKETGALTLTNVATGASLIGSAGSSVAGALAGAAPVGIAVGAALLGSEAVCYFLDDRITEYDEVLTVMSLLAHDADPSFFALIMPETPLKHEDFILVREADSEVMAKYMVRDLYIVNGVLKNRDRFRNTVIGNVGFVAAD